MTLFLISFTYFSQLNHNLYQYQEETFSVTSWGIELEEDQWTIYSRLYRYRRMAGLKEFTFRYDSILINKNYYHLLAGDNNRVRGLLVGSKTKGFGWDLQVGKMQDIIPGPFPTYNRNLFYSELDLSISGHNFFLVGRWDKDSYLPLLGDQFVFKHGNLSLLNDIKISYRDRPGIALYEDLYYKRLNLFLRSFLRYFSSGFSDKENIVYSRGRVNWGMNSSYRFPFGLSIHSGAGFRGMLDEKLAYLFLGGLSFYMPGRISFDFTNNLMGGGYRDWGYRRYLRLNVPFKRHQFLVNYEKSSINKERESFGLEGQFYLSGMSRLDLSFERMSLYGWDISFGGMLSPFRNLRTNWRFQYREDRLYYNTSLSWIGWGNWIGRFGIAGNTETNSKQYRLEITKSGTLEEFGIGGVTGLIWQDENGDRIRQEGEPPVRDIEVILDEERRTKVDERGRYKFRLVPKGKHTIKLDIKGVPAFLGTERVEKSFTSGFFDVQVIDFPIYGLSSIQGRVYYDKNHNSKWDPDEGGVPNVRITVKINKFKQYTYTRQNGTYLISNLVPGVYTVTASILPPGYELSPKGLVLYIELTPGTKRKGLNFGVAIPKKEVEIKRF